MKKWLLLVLLFIPFCGYGQIITTIAGGGSSLADGIPATNASISYTEGIAIDHYGNLYIGDGNNQKVRKVDAVTGIITTVAGTGIAGYNGDGILATAAQLNQPGYVNFDKIGNLYIGDANNNRIRKVDAVTGIITTYAGNGILGYNGDGGLADTSEISNGVMAMDTFGNMYIGDDFRIRKVDAVTGIITTIAGTGISGSAGDGGQATAASVNYEIGICTDIFGNIYFSDNNNYTVRKIDINTGIISKIAGTGIVSNPYLGDGLPATASHINPFGIAVDSIGDLFVSDYGNSRAEKVDISGIVHTVTGNGMYGLSGDGGPATAGVINRPENVALDACGNLYISDFGNRRVRKVILNTSTPLITISTNTGDHTCAGTIVTYTTTVTGSTTFAYQWYINGVLVSSAGSAYTYTPANGDSVRCVFTGSSLCSGAATVSSNTVNMVVDTLAVPTISISGITSAAVGSLVTVSATVTNAGSSYNIKWFKNSTLFSTTTVPFVSYTKAAGLDLVTARVIPTSSGCYDSATSAVHTVAVTVDGVNTINNLLLHIYPNPVSEVIHIDGVTGQASYRLLSIVGAVLQHGDLKVGENSLSVKGLASGVYVLEVVGSDGQKIISKVIKQ